MSFYQLKDGRWVVQYRDSKRNGRYKREYFGRGKTAELQAKERNRALGLASYTLGHRKKQDTDANSKAIKTRQKPHEKVIKQLVSSLKRWYEEKEIQTEVKVPLGSIDILTPDEIIEVKNIPEWKQAVGQLLIYHSSFPDKRLRLHLFQKTPQSRLATIISNCKPFKISVTHESNPELLPSAVKQRLERRATPSPNVDILRAAINKLPSLTLPS